MKSGLIISMHCIKLVYYAHVYTYTESVSGLGYMSSLTAKIEEENVNLRTSFSIARIYMY